MEEKLKISDYLLDCIEFRNNPSNQEAYQRILDFNSNVVIREYMPLKEKEVCLVNILNSISDDFDAPGTAAILEMVKVEKGLLEYCINIENDMNNLYLMYDAYDMIHQYGLYDIIIEHCGKDFAKLSEMVNNAIDITNITRLVQTTSLFNREEYDKWIKSMQELKSTLDSDSIKGLLAFNASHNGLGDDLIGKIQEESVRLANEELKNEQEKFKSISKYNKEENKHE